MSVMASNGLHGIGRLVAEPDEPARPAGAPPARLFEQAHPLSPRAETVRGVWIRQIDLENPGP